MVKMASTIEVWPKYPHATSSVMTSLLMCAGSYTTKLLVTET